jgi:hypothetical protein
MMLGTVIHDAVLCGGDGNVVMIPESVLTANGQRRGKAWEAFRAQHADRVLLRPRDAAIVAEVREACYRHPTARRLLEFDGGGRSEHVLHWTHDETGTPCRGRADRLTPAFIADLKTTSLADLDAFGRKAYDFGYHRQAAFYLDGARANGLIEIGFAFIVAQVIPPFGVMTFVLDQPFIGAGFAENDRLLREFAECQRTGKWQRHDYGRLLTLSKPAWAGNN